MRPTVGEALLSIIVAVATILVIVGVSVVVFLNPVWVGFEQDRSGAETLTGYPPAEVHAVTGSILLNGREIVGLDDDALRQMRGDEVSMIFQDPSASLDPTWLVCDQVAETIRAHRYVSAA